MEWYMRDGALIDSTAWSARIDALNESSASGDWMAAFEQAVLSRAAQQTGRIGVLFSGGVDSTLIAFILHKHDIPLICYTVGFHDAGTKEPEDVIEARRIAQQYGWEHRCAVLDLEELEPVVAETARILGDAANPITVGVGAVIVAGARLAAADGVTVLFSGLGSEEIFAGYDRHGKADDVQAECWRGLYGMRERDLIRDTRIASALGISIPTPFLDPGVLAIGMRLPASQKIVEGQKKHILRAMAVAYGLPEEFAFRPKRAAQYGSRVDGALERLARRHGSSKKGYVSSLARPKRL